MGKLYPFHGRIIEYYLGLCDMSQHASRTDYSERERSLKYQAIQVALVWGAQKMTVYTKLKSCCLYGKFWS